MTQHEVPFINASEATKRSIDRTENGKCANITNRRSRVGLSTPFYTDVSDQPSSAQKSRKNAVKKKFKKITRSSVKEIRIAFEKYITPLASSILTNRSRVWPVNHLSHQTIKNLLEIPPKNLTRKSNSKIQLENPTRNPSRNPTGSPNSVNRQLHLFTICNL